MFLPPESLVPFRAQRLANATLIYADPADPQFAEPEKGFARYAYAIPSANLPDNMFHPREKVFYAERYGGSRIVTHGGGARSGFEGPYSVKGMGCNPLLGEDAAKRSYAHSTGVLTLAEAVRETIAANVMDELLPHGAVRTSAIIATGFSLEGRHLGNASPTALLVRKNILRPAHFERSPYFLPRENVEFVHDATRVKRVIQLLPDRLPVPADWGAARWNALKAGEKLRLGLEELSKRYASQAAVAYAHRAVHSMITDSNLSLNGKWLDTATVHFNKSHANGTPSARTPPMAEEHLQYVSVLRNLYFHVQKYHERAGEAELPSQETVIALFCSHYRASLSLAIVRLTGLPLGFLEEHKQDTRLLNLAELLMCCAKDGMEKFFIAAGPGALAKFGSSPLGKILPILACWYDHDSCNSRLEAFIPSLQHRTALVYAYSLLAEEARQHYGELGISDQAFRRITTLKSAKAARHVSALDVESMPRNLGTLPEGDLAEVICRASDEATTLYSDASPLKTIVFCRGSQRVTFNAETDQWEVYRDNIRHSLHWTAIYAAQELAEANRYWGGILWRMLAEREDYEPEYPRLVADA